MKRKAISLAIAAFMAFGALSGCAATPAASTPAPAAANPGEPASGETAAEPAGETGAELSASGLPLTAEPKTLKVWMAIDGTAANNVTTYAETVSGKEAMERTGVTIEYTHPAGANQQEQFNLIVGSGNFPDIMWYNSNSAKYTGGLDALVTDGIAEDLNNYLEIMPNMVNVMNRNAETAKQFKTDEGRYPIAWMVNIEKEWDWGGPLVRKDWLDDLELAIPETYDDWHTMLTAFKEQKGATVPLSAGAKEFFVMLESLNAGYGTADSFINVDGTIVFSPISQEYKDFLTLMAQWYAEGLIDPEFMTRDSADATPLANNLTGALQFGVWTQPTQYETLYGSVWAPAPYPVKTKGEVTHLGWQQYEICSDGMAITTTCSDKELAARWLDYFYSDEGSLLKNYGIEGETFEYIEGKAELNDAVREAKADGTKGNYDFFGVSLTGIYDWQNALYGNDPKNLVCYDVWDASTDGAYTLPPISMTSDEGSRFATIMGDINTYVQENTVKFISGATDVNAEWDAYVAQIESMNVAEATSIQQAALDRYNNR